MDGTEDGEAQLAARFAGHRGRLEAIAYRMLGSRAEAEDAVQDTWVRLSRAGTEGVESLGAWLTTIVARVCLNRLQSRSVRREDLTAHVPDPLVGPEEGLGPEDQAVLADSVGLALIVVLDTLGPAERLAFVLHDLFGVPFDEIGPMVGRTPTAARQLASRARRRVRGAGTPVPDPDLTAQRAVVEAFFAAARRGDFAGLVAVLDPDVTLRSDGGTGRPEATAVLRGAQEVAGRAIMFAQPDAPVHPVLVNGAAGVVITAAGRPVSVIGFTVVAGRIVEIDAVADPVRLATLDLGRFEPSGPD